MKKITLLFAFVATTLGFSQATHTIDFESSGVGADWSWSAEADAPLLSIVANPDTNVNTSATVVKFETYSTDKAWALTVTDDNGEFTFDATNATVKIMVHKPVASNVGIKFEGASAPIQVLVANTVINGWEELTFDFSAQIGNTYNRLVVIPDFADRTETHINYFDNIQLPQGVLTTIPGPSTDAPTPPTRDAADVISIFSDSYTDISGTNYTSNWNADQGTQVNVAYDPTSGGTNTAIQYSQFDYQGIIFGAPFPDASEMENLHIDVWTDVAGTVLTIKPMNGGVPGGAETEAVVNIPIVNAGWSSVDLARNSFSTMEWGSIYQIVMDATSGTDPTVVYIDNFYFWKAPTAGLEDISANSVKMYPNPANGVVNFSSASNEAFGVAVYDLLGKQVMGAQNVQSQLNISSLNPGMYFVNMTQGSSTSIQKLLVK